MKVRVTIEIDTERTGDSDASYIARQAVKMIENNSDWYADDVHYEVVPDEASPQVCGFELDDGSVAYYGI